jgi:hypothetical protein
MPFSNGAPVRVTGTSKRGRACVDCAGGFYQVRYRLRTDGILKECSFSEAELESIDESDCPVSTEECVGCSCPTRRSDASRSATSLVSESAEPQDLEIFRIGAPVTFSHSAGKGRIFKKCGTSRFCVAYRMRTGGLLKVMQNCKRTDLMPISDADALVTVEEANKQKCDCR